MFAAVEAANERFADKLASRWTITHGDEVQGMLATADADACLPLCEHFIDALQPQSVRIGAGLGKLATKLQPTAIGMDGEAWHRAQAAIEQARRTRATFFLKGPDETVEKDINAMFDYLLSHRLSWTDLQREAVLLLQTLSSQQAVARQITRGEAAVSTRLSGCMWSKYRALHGAAQRQLGRYITAEASSAESDESQPHVKPGAAAKL